MGLAWQDVFFQLLPTLVFVEATIYHIDEANEQAPPLPRTRSSPKACEQGGADSARAPSAHADSAAEWLTGLGSCRLGSCRLRSCRLGSCRLRSCRLRSCASPRCPAAPSTTSSACIFVLYHLMPGLEAVGVAARVLPGRGQQAHAGSGAHWNAAGQHGNAGCWPCVCPLRVRPFLLCADACKGGAWPERGGNGAALRRR
jgi:hypothetical protein